MIYPWRSPATVVAWQKERNRTRRNNWFACEGQAQFLIKAGKTCIEVWIASSLNYWDEADGNWMGIVWLYRVALKVRFESVTKVTVLLVKFAVFVAGLWASSNRMKVIGIAGVVVFLTCGYTENYNCNYEMEIIRITNVKNSILQKIAQFLLIRNYCHFKKDALVLFSKVIWHPQRSSKPSRPLGVSENTAGGPWKR